MLSQGDGTPAVGRELGRDLWAAGGADGDDEVVHTRTGRVRATYQLVPETAPGESFVDDVVVTGRTAWVTDSLQAALFRVRDALYLPNARFSTPATPTTEYWVTRLVD